MCEYFGESKSLGGRAKKVLIHENQLKEIDLANLKSNKDKLDIDKLKNAPTNLSNLESKVDKLDNDKLVPAPVDLSNLSDTVKMVLLKKIYITLRSKILKIKYLILVIQLLILLLIL